MMPVKRPTTAVVGPALVHAHGLERRRLASNSILNLNARTRASNRGFQYNKNSYQSNGLERVTSKVNADIMARKQAQTSAFNRPEGGEIMVEENEGPEGAEAAVDMEA